MPRHCPLWVNNEHRGTSVQCPLYPQKRTLIERVGMSALCQKQTYAVQQFGQLFDHLVGELQEMHGHIQAQRLGGL